MLIAFSPTLTRAERQQYLNCVVSRIWQHCILTDAKRHRIKKKTLHETAQCEIPDENSIVRVRKLAKNLKCTSCRSFLDMEKLSDFSVVLSSRHLSLVMPWEKK